MNWSIKSTKRFVQLLNYKEHFHILASRVTGCIYISSFATVIGIAIGITSSTIGLAIFAITAAIKEYKSNISKNKKKQYK